VYIHYGRAFAANGPHQALHHHCVHHELQGTNLTTHHVTIQVGKHTSHHTHCTVLDCTVMYCVLDCTHCTVLYCTRTVLIVDCIHPPPHHVTIQFRAAGAAADDCSEGGHHQERVAEATTGGVAGGVYYRTACSIQY
jgi:hypothetical protein